MPSRRRSRSQHVNASARRAKIRRRLFLSSAACQRLSFRALACGSMRATERQAFRLDPVLVLTLDELIPALYAAPRCGDMRKHRCRAVQQRVAVKKSPRARPIYKIGPWRADRLSSQEPRRPRPSARRRRPRFCHCEVGDVSRRTLDRWLRRTASCGASGGTREPYRRATDAMTEARARSFCSFLPPPRTGGRRPGILERRFPERCARAVKVALQCIETALPASRARSRRVSMRSSPRLVRADGVYRKPHPAASTSERRGRHSSLSSSRYRRIQSNSPVTTWSTASTPKGFGCVCPLRRTRRICTTSSRTRR